MICGIAHKHLERGVPCSEILPCAMCWIPKESQESIACCLITIFTYYAQHNVRLKELVSAFMVDGHGAALAAIREA